MPFLPVSGHTVLRCLALLHSRILSPFRLIVIFCFNRITVYMTFVFGSILCTEQKARAHCIPRQNLQLIFRASAPKEYAMVV